MPLSAKEILKNIDAGNIFVDPFVQENVKGASVDVQLGHYYFVASRYNSQTGIPNRIRNPWACNAAQMLWGKQREALQAKDLAGFLTKHWHFSTMSNAFWGKEFGFRISNSDLLIVVGPREKILTHTEEFIGSNTSFVGDMRGRSSVYRSALTVSSDGNWGDPAFFGRWSLKIENQTDDIVILPVGRRIAQIVFHEVHDGQTYAKENGGGKYQTTDDRERIKREWKPEMILPRLHLDREVRKATTPAVREHLLEVP